MTWINRGPRNNVGGKERVENFKEEDEFGIEEKMCRFGLYCEQVMLTMWWWFSSIPSYADSKKHLHDSVFLSKL
jgi:hypothetical protein